MGSTIKEIAKLAGVSRGTVDRVIHNRPGVSPKIREQVQQILREAKYEPNTAAVALKSTVRNLTIGVIIPDLRNEFFCNVYEGIQEASHRYRGYGVMVEEYRMEDSTGEELVRGIDALMEKGIDALALQAIDVPIVRDRLAALPDIPLVTFNSDLADSHRICFVGQDAFAAGEVAGRMMRLHLRQQGAVAVIIGRSALTHQVERVQGFDRIMQGSSLVSEFLGPVEIRESDSVAYDTTLKLLQNRPDLIGIYAAGGGQKGIAAALDDSGRARDVIMIGHDLLPKTVEYLNAGVVNCTIAQAPYFQGYLPVEILAEYLLFHREPESEKMYATVDIRIKENVAFQGIGFSRADRFR